MHRDVKKQFSPELFFRSHLRTRVAAQRHARGTRAGRRRWLRTPSGHAKRPGDLRVNRHAAVCPAVYLTIQAFGTLQLLIVLQGVPFPKGKERRFGWV